MHYVWHHRLWTPSQMRTVDGRRVDVLDPGLPNTDAGPDFFNAKVKIGDRLWAGNVELHTRASDWERHGHSADRAYDSVILHVVGADDARVNRPDGSEIPQLVMACAPDFRHRYDAMVGNLAAGLPCAAELRELPPVYMSDWLNALAFERLYRKSERVAGLVRHFGGDWGSAVFVVLARALGFGTNAEPFERLAMALPLRMLLKHCDDTMAVEGVLFGQAGFLDGQRADNGDNYYIARLKQEHAFMAAKFGLDAPRQLGWKMARMRPPNFPHRRLAALAAMISAGFPIAYNIFGVAGEDDARALFDVELSGYWSRRYNFSSEGAPAGRAFSDSSVSTLIVNVVVSVLHAYAAAYGRDDMRERAVALLQGLAPEHNSVTRIFTGAGIPCPDAFTSQAMIELRRSYCEPRKCLYCRPGHRILAKKAIKTV